MSMTLLEAMSLESQIFVTNGRGNMKHEQTWLFTSPGSVVDPLSAKDNS